MQLSEPVSRRVARGELLSVAMLLAFLNVGVGFAVSTHGQNHLLSFLVNVAATLVAVLILWVILRLVVGWPVVRLLKTSDRMAWWIASLPLTSLAVLLPLAGRASHQGESGTGALLTLTLVGTTLFAIVYGYGLLGWARQSRFLEVFAVWAPIAALVALVALWLILFRVEVIGDQSGLPTLSAVLVCLVFVVFCIVLGVVLWRIDCERWSGVLMSTVLALVLTSPAIVWLVKSGVLQQEPPAALSRNKRVEHVILLTVDTLRADALSSDSAELSPTPRLDGLMRQSVVFRNARSPAPWTRPAVASILTGLSPAVHGTVHRTSRLPDEVKTLAEFFEESGYLTAALGRNGAIGEGLNFDQGITDYRFYLGNEAAPSPSLGSQLLRSLGWLNLTPSTADLARMASEWIEANYDKPFFLWVHFLDPHAPYAPPDPYLPGEDPPGRMRRRFSGVDAIREGQLSLSVEEQEWVRSLYRGEVTYVDTGVGLILDTLRQVGIYEDAVIVVTSDHGEEFYEHGLAGHGHTLFDELLRVPLIIRWPGQHEGMWVDDDVSTESVTPTILEMAGIDSGSYPFQAASLEWVWGLAGRQNPRTPIVSSGLLFYGDRSGVIFDGFKYLEPVEDGPAELYDLYQDPDERESLAAGESEKVEEMNALLERHAKQSAALRDVLGLAGEESVEMSPELEKELRALGYIN